MSTTKTTERKILIFVFCIVGSRIVVSDGLKSRPHCSWTSTYPWNIATKEECEKQLCLASGHCSRKFINASNEMCSTSAVSRSHWNWKNDENQLKYDEWTIITAYCSVTGDLLHLMFHISDHDNSLVL